MQINDDWKIEADSLQYILLKKTAAKVTDEDDGDSAKDPAWRVIGYYATIHGALESMVNKEIRGTGMKDFKTIVAKLDELLVLIKGIKER